MFFILNEVSLKCLRGTHERKGFPFWFNSLCLNSMAHILSSVTFNKRKGSMPVYTTWSTSCSSSQNGIGDLGTLIPFASPNKCIAQQFLCNCNCFKYLKVYTKKKIGGGHTRNVLHHFTSLKYHKFSITVVPKDSAYIPLIVNISNYILELYVQFAKINLYCHQALIRLSECNFLLYLQLFTLLSEVCTLTSHTDPNERCMKA